MPLGVVLVVHLAVVMLHGTVQTEYSHSKDKGIHVSIPEVKRHIRKTEREMEREREKEKKKERET